MSPTNVTAIVVNSTVISVQWDGLTPCRYVNGHIVKYRVQYTSESSGVIESKDERGNWNVTEAKTSLTGLTPYTNYTIRVAAVNVKGHVGLYSRLITNQTDEYCKFFFFTLKIDYNTLVFRSWSCGHHIINLLFVDNMHVLDSTTCF